MSRLTSGHLGEPDTSTQDLHTRLKDELRNATSVLDVGCGRGIHLAGSSAAAALHSVRSRGGRVIGIDVVLPVGGNPLIDDIRLIGSDGKWPVADESVDLAICDWVLEHVLDPPVFFDECSRVLVPGGKFIARSMQAWSVAGIGARIVPRRWHTPMIKRLQPGMNADDLFPTALRCNTRAALENLATDRGMRLLDFKTHRTLAGYGFGNPSVERALSVFERSLPTGMHHGIVFAIEKRTASA